MRTLPLCLSPTAHRSLPLVNGPGHRALTPVLTHNILYSADARSHACIDSREASAPRECPSVLSVCLT